MFQVPRSSSARHCEERRCQQGSHLLQGSASFSPDGARVVTASADQTAAIWSAAGGEKIFTLTHNDVVWSASFSPDGARVVTASQDGTAAMWSAADVGCS